MIPQLRRAFNAQFTPAKYRALLADLNNSFDNSLDFRICETPFFFPRSLAKKVFDEGAYLVRTLREPGFLEKMEAALPSNLRVPHETDHAKFIVVDFALARNAAGEIVPRLIELQGFPTTLCFESILDQKIRRHFDIPEDFTCYFSGQNFSGYLKALREILLGDHDPENVVLLEVRPERQKTRVDFVCTEKQLGIKPVCVSDVILRGNRLFYRTGGREIPINRIYNRVIFDELVRTDVPRDFFFSKDLRVEWVGHPNWFFKISKYTLPHLQGECCPRSFYLGDVSEIPGDLENYVLKPLFSFAGSGVQVDVTRDMLENLSRKENYILQEKVNYAPVLETPNGKAKAEIRLVYFWDQTPRLMINHVRVSKGKMMGVDFNKFQDWVGSTVGYHPRLSD